jgi:hypothetical protein
LLARLKDGHPPSFFTFKDGALSEIATAMTASDSDSRYSRAIIRKSH